MAFLINRQTGQPEQVPSNSVRDAIISGEFIFPAGQRVSVLSPDGEKGTIDGSEAFQAFSGAYQYLSEEDQERLKLEEQYGDSDVKAFLAAAARGATFGLSDQALTKSGLVDPETLQGLKRANPDLSLAGEIAGGVGSSILPLGAAVKGAGLAAKGARALGTASKFTPASVVSNISAKATAGAGSTLAGKATTGAIAGIIEGAASGAGQVISEDALGTADANAQRLIAGAVLGGGIGAAFGGGVGVIGGMLTKGVNQLTKTGENIKKMTDEEIITAQIARQKQELGKEITAKEKTVLNKLSELAFNNPASRAVKSVGVEAVEALGNDPEEIAKFFGTSAQDAKLRKASQLSLSQKDKIVEDVTKLFNEQKKANEKLVNKLTKVVKPAKIKELLEDAELEPIFAQASKLSDDLRDLITTAESTPSFYTGTQKIAQFKKIQNDLDDLLLNAKTADEIYLGLDKFKGKVQSNLKYGFNVPDDQKDTFKLFESFEKGLRAHLEDEAIYGDAAILQKKINPVVTQYLRKLKGFDMLFGKKDPTLGYRPQTMTSEGKIKTFLNATGRRNLASSTTERKRATAGFTEQSNELIDLANDLTDEAQIELFADDVYKSGLQKWEVENKRRTDLWEDNLNFGGGAKRVSDQISEAVLEIKESVGQKSTKLNDLVDEETKNLKKQIEKFDEKILDLSEDYAAGDRLDAALGGGVFSRVIKGSVQALDFMQTMYNKTQSYTKESVSQMLDSSRKIKGSGAARRSLIFGTNSLFSKDKKDRRKEYKEVIEKSRTYLVSNGLTSEILSKNMGDLYEGAPDSMMKAAEVVNNSFNYIIQKAPRSASSEYGGFGEFENLVNVSDSQIDSFLNVVDTVNNPYKILADMRLGVVNPESVDVVKTLYPEIFRSIQDEIMAQVMEKGINLSYNQRAIISSLFNISLSADYNPALTMLLQNSFNQQQDESNVIKPSNRMLRNIDTSLQTQTQRVSS